MKYYILYIFCWLCTFESAQGQNEAKQEMIRIPESGIENESIRSDQVQEDYQLFDAIEQYTRTPLLINSASLEDLEAFPFLDDAQIVALLQHIKYFGKLITIEELQVIPGFDDELIRSVKPLVTVGRLAGQKTISIRNLLSEGMNTLMLRVQKSIENKQDQPSFPGSDEKIYFRYKYQFADRIRLGITAEKDPGEPFFQGAGSAGFDFYSGHLIIKSKSIIRQLTLGDYSIQHGQGVVMWSGMSFGKSSDVLNIQKNPGGVRPYTSVDENNFFRGACLTAQINKWRSDIFFSSHSKDGNIIDNNGQESFTALQSSGYHRTTSELEDKKSINETISGILLNKIQGPITFGAIVYQTIFSKPLVKENKLYNLYEFQGSSNFNYGFHFKYLYKNTSTFGEAGRSKNGAWAFLVGSMIHLHPKLSYAVLLRSYQKNYQSLYAAAFGENSKTANETGLFSGFQLKLPRNLTLSAYSDCFQFPWLKYMVDAPSSGYEFLAQLKWKPKRTFESYLQFKTKVKENNATELTDILHHIESQKMSNIRWNIRIKLTETWEWGSRVEHSMFKQGDEENRSGFLIFQDLIFHPLNSPFAIGLRYEIFDTDDYDTRIYTYENDVLFSYSVPALQGRGDRFYINLHYRMNRMLELWLRYSVTSTRIETQFASGTGIEGDPKKEVKAQLRMRF